jgi:hypothetical protein
MVSAEFLCALSEPGDQQYPKLMVEIKNRIQSTLGEKLQRHRVQVVTTASAAVSN